MRRLFGVVGDPVAHSLSPRLHRFWYEATGFAADYVALNLVSETVDADLQALARAGFAGLNVTLPHKIAAMSACSTLSDAAASIGAVNTLVRSGNDRSWLGHNTDWSGLSWALDRLIGGGTMDKPLMIGAGGSARAVAYALGQRGLAFDLVNRTTARAETLCREMDLNTVTVLPLAALAKAASNTALVINTTSAGHSGEMLDLPETEGGVFLDLSYGAAAHGMANAARARGWQVEDGLAMLVGQAADAFTLWFGIEPDREAGLSMLRAHLDREETAP